MKARIMVCQNQKGNIKVLQMHVNLKGSESIKDHSLFLFRIMTVSLLIISFALICIPTSVSSKYTERDMEEDRDRIRSDMKGHGLVPSFFQSQVASICNALVGDLCPRQHVPYDDRDDRDHPLMGNSKIHDIRFDRNAASGRGLPVPVNPRLPVWPAPHQRPEAQQDQLRFVDPDDAKVKQKDM